MSELVLEKVRFAVSNMTSQTFRDNMKIDDLDDYTSETFIQLLKWWLWGRDVTQTTQETFKYPANWKEALKERWLPNFLKKRFPIKYEMKDVVIHHFHVCPHLDIPARGVQVHLQFLEGSEP